VHVILYLLIIQLFVIAVKTNQAKVDRIAKSLVILEWLLEK